MLSGKRAGVAAGESGLAPDDRRLDRDRDHRGAAGHTGASRMARGPRRRDPARAQRRRRAMDRDRRDRHSTRDPDRRVRGDRGDALQNVARAHARAIHDRDNGAPVVVGGALPEPRSAADVHHRERDSHSRGRADCAARPVRRRHSQLLGAAAAGEDRCHSRADEHVLASRGFGRRVSRTVRGILRHTARAHGAAGGGTAARAVRVVGRAAASAGTGAHRQSRERGTRRIRASGVRALSCDSGNRRSRKDGTGSHSRREPPDAGCRNDSEHTRDISPDGS